MEKNCLHNFQIEFAKLIGNYEFERARDLALKTNFTSLSAERERQLLLTKVYILEGSFCQAQESLDTFRLLNGEVERALLEQLNLYYLSGAFSKWSTAIFRGLNQLNIQDRFRLLNLSVVDQIGVAKHLEEAGFITEVIEFFEHLQTQKLADGDFIKVSAQLIRLYSIWEVSGPLPKLYQTLSLLNQCEINKDFFIEVNHGLLLADLVLFGEKQAQARLKKLLTLNLDNFDKKLILFDYIELFIHLKKTRPTIDVNSVNIDLLDAYETQIYQIVFSNTEKFRNELNSTEYSCGGFFRILALHNSLGIKIPSVHIHQCLFLVKQFSKKTKTIWLHRLSLLSAEAQNSVVKIDSHIASSNDISVSFSKQPILAHILRKIAEYRGNLSIEFLSQELFNEDPDLKNQDRIRVHIARLNKIFQEKLGIVKPFKISNGSILSDLQFQM